MAQGDHDSNFQEATYIKLRGLCCRPQPLGNQKTVISDKDFQTIRECLEDLGYAEYAERPRHYAVLTMMNRIDLLSAFTVAGLLDNSFPYPDRKSLLPPVKRDHEASHQFIELQFHVMSAACLMEKGSNSPHVYADSGDVFFLHLNKLGKGGNASVDKVESRVTKFVYARKKISRNRGLQKDKSVIRAFENELQILKRIDHHHLVKVWASYTDLKFVAILMKPVAEMDLKRYLLTCGQLFGDERTRFRTYYGCLVSALAYLHDNKIRHKDIKPSNILLNRGDIYITDFGTAVEFDEDRSQTTGTVKARTPRYQSPEVSRGTKRGIPSDIWSLGVTFLEMTTTFRGESIKAMNDYMVRNGAQDEFVFANISGAIQWLEHLRKNTKFPRTDNAPIAWIRDMILEKATDRHNAQQLLESIKQAPGTWCCKDCRHEGSSTSDSGASSEENNDDEDTARQPFPQPLAEEKPSVPEHLDVQAIQVDPVILPRSPLHKQVASKLSGYFSLARIYSSSTSSEYTDLPRVSPPEVFTSFSADDVKEYSVQLTAEVDTIVDNSDPWAINVPGSFPDHLANEEPHVAPPDEGYPQPEPISSTKPEAADLVSKSSGAFELEAPCALSGYIPLDKDANLLAPFSIDDDYGKRTSEEQPSSSMYPLEMDHCLLAEPAFSESTSKQDSPARKAIRSLQNFMSHSSGRKLLRSRSDENLEIQHETRSLLPSLESHFLDIALTVQLKKYEDGGGSDGGQPDDDEGGSREDSLAQFRSFKIDLDLKLKPKSEKEFERKNSEAESKKAPREKKLLEYKNIPKIVEQYPDAKKFLQNDSIKSKTENKPKSAVPPHPTVESFTEQYVASTIIALEDNELLDPNTPSDFDFRRPDTPGPVIDNVLHPPSNPVPVRPNTNPLKSWFANARGPPSARPPPTGGPSRLTGQNLGAHNNEIPPLRVSPTPFKLESARVYMRQVYDDAASSVATSLMSTRTKENFKSAGLFLPLQDRTNNFLGRYAAMGKADAVRLLLRQGCNPGTKREPRPGPLFSVIRGASSRHNKCLRALIQAKVDVNIKASKSGKTPLIEAIEQEAWPGYVTVIILLLQAGANPNTKDNSGDNPILKLLQGGLNPLAEHHRKALALLLSTTYKTNVSVTPLGTRNKPLHLAIRRKDPWAVGMLLQKPGCDVEAENSEGLTPLQLAARAWNANMTSDQLEILDLLLEKKADADCRRLSTGNTPLHIAIVFGLVHAVERLLSYGADVTLKTDDGKTALVLCKERKKVHGCHGGCYDCLEIERMLKKKY